jgi:hypothetical protein
MDLRKRMDLSGPDWINIAKIPSEQQTLTAAGLNCGLEVLALSSLTLIFEKLLPH